MLAEVTRSRLKKQTKLSHQTDDFETHLMADFETTLGIFLNSSHLELSLSLLYSQLLCFLIRLLGALFELIVGLLRKLFKCFSTHSIGFAGLRS